MPKEMETIYLGSGCFWCAEAVFRIIRGVETVTPGYSGGKVSFPSYGAVCTGNTGHVEVVKLSYDTSVIGTDEILDVFFAIHDPTSWDRQGADEGSQYRSVIFHTSQNQAEIARSKIADLESSGAYSFPIVTQVRPFEVFYPAEHYHNNYYGRNRDAAYCRYVIDPKIEKINRDFRAMVLPGSE